MVETVYFHPNDPEYNRRLLDLYASKHAGPNVDPPEQPEYRALTDEEWEIYNMIMDESEGFGTWHCPKNIREMGLIRTVLVSEEESPDEYETFNELSLLALDQYNDQQGTNFQLVKVLKANVEFGGSCTYYLTFQAEDTASGAFENFQARGIYHYTLEREVDLVRLEPKKSLPLEVAESGKGTSIDSISPSETMHTYFSSTDVPVKSCL